LVKRRRVWLEQMRERCLWGVVWVRFVINALFGNIVWLIEGGVGGLGLGVEGVSLRRVRYPHTKKYLST